MEVKTEIHSIIGDTKKKSHGSLYDKDIKQMSWNEK